MKEMKHTMSLLAYAYLKHNILNAFLIYCSMFKNITSKGRRQTYRHYLLLGKVGLQNLRQAHSTEHVTVGFQRPTFQTVYIPGYPRD